MLFSKKHVKVNPRCLVNTVDFSKPDLVCPDFPNKLFFYQLHMNYQEFLTTIKTQLSLRIDADATLDIRRFTKNNGTDLDGLIIFRPNLNISPTIYLNPYYHRYLQGVPMEDIYTDILITYQEHLPEEDIDVSFFTDFAKAKKLVTMRLVNYKQNEKMLQEVPHFPQQALGVKGLSGGHLLLPASCQRRE